MLKTDRFVGAIEAIFRVNAADATELANDLFKRNKLAYEATVNVQLEALGQEGDFRLKNRDELKRLKAEATESALSIAKTYNEELANRVDAVVEAERTRGLNRATLAKRLNDWDVERAAWKQAQITQTEANRTVNGAVSAFIQNSRLDDVVRYRLTPAESSHDDPNDKAARNGTLLTHSELEDLGLPAHVNERHSPVIAFPKDLDAGAVWLGA